MARRYNRDARGRFAPKGYSGQSGGQGARLKSGKGNTRQGGGKKENLIGANDQTMTSLPKGTIGKTQKLRNRSSMDMGGQRFAKYEADKKAAKNEISRAKQEAFFNDMQKTIDAKPLSRKPTAQSQEMSKAEFARKTGGKTRDDSMSAAIEMSRQPHGRTKAGDRRNEARLRKLQDEVRATDKAYDAAVKSGKIKKPSDSLARKAAGDPGNPAVQAAKRLQAKIAAKRASQSRGDTASVNRPMAGSRGRALDREISRNVKAQKAEKRAASKALNSKVKSEMSRAKKLRAVHETEVAKSFAKKHGKSVTEVRSAIRSMTPAKQIKFFQQHVKETRKGKRK